MSATGRLLGGAGSISFGGAVRRAAAALGAVACATAFGAACSSFPEPPEAIATTQQQVSSTRECEPNCSTWVYPSRLSKDLVYVPDPEGDRVADFSRVGYKGGAYGLPSESAPPETNPTIADNEIDLDTVNWAPSGKPPQTLTVDSTFCSTFDHTDRIKEMIAAVAARPRGSNGVRGRVYLPRAHYAIKDTLTIPDGVVLAGHSSGAWTSHVPPLPATVFHLCGTATSLIKVGGDDSYGSLSGDPRPIVDDNVPSGATCFHVDVGSASFAKGNRVLITRLDSDPSQVNSPFSRWNHDLGVTTTTDPSDLGPSKYARTVTVVQAAENGLGSTTQKIICVDQPVTSALEGTYGPHTIEKFTTPPAYAKNAGVTRIRGISDFDYGGDCPDDQSGMCPKCCDPNSAGVCEPSKTTLTTVCPAQSMIGTNNLEDGWIYDVIAEHFSISAVRFSSRTRRTTADKVQYVNPNGPIAGGWRYPFMNLAQTNLVANSYADYARHPFMIHTFTVGPNAFVNSYAEHTKEDSGAHTTWSTGALYDNVDMRSISGNHTYSGQFSVRNVGGTHGWEGSSNVFFNTSAYRGYGVFNPVVNAGSHSVGQLVPPGSGQNWLLGVVGVTDHFAGNPTASLNEMYPHLDRYATSINDQRVKLITTDLADAPLADPTIGDSLYRTSRLYYPLKTGDPSLLSYDSGLDVRHYTVGDPDDFTAETGDGFNDVVYVDPLFKTWLNSKNSVQSYKGFDYTLNSNGNSDAQNVPFSITYDLASNETVKFAYLAVRMMRVGAWNQDADHYIQIAGVSPFEGFADATANARTYYWRCTSGAPAGCQALPSDLTGPIGWSTAAGSAPDPISRVRIIELPASLFSGLLNRTIVSGGRRYGELNMNFGVKTRFDWVSLTLVIKRP